MDNSADLRVLLASRHPLLAVETQEEDRLMALLRQAAASLELPVWTWSASRGLARDGYDPQYGTVDPRRALDWVDSLGTPGVFVFADIHSQLEHPQVVRAVKELAQHPLEGRTLVLTAPHRAVPAELEGLALAWSLRPPSAAELTALVERTVADLSERDLAVELSREEIDAIAEAVRGLTIAEAERLIQQAAIRDGRLDGGDVAYVRRAKAELLAADGILELVEGDVGTLDEVGGLDHLKQWLAVRLRAQEARIDGLEAPRGILLTGVPGCGKSLVAKSLARSWERPLILLDPSRLYRPYIGESEQRLDQALRSVEAMAPVVLWLDEIEKGFAAGGRGDGGVSQRLLGTFLRWMQERSPGVFLVATANDVRSLPPELARKGRFDEVFFVDLPDLAARRRILELHLGRRNHRPDGFELRRLAAACDGFSGAEIEAAVVAAVYRSFGAGRELASADVLAEMEATVPLSVSRAEDVARLREWARTRAVAA